jgi:enamine deaminase RidA (YjgF/YER057c/UK114 family)
LEIIQSAIEGLGGKLSDVTRTRILLTRIEDWEQVAAVHGEFFGSIRPANTIMQVVRFIDTDWLVEIEADAVVGTRREHRNHPRHSHPRVWNSPHAIP